MSRHLHHRPALRGLADREPLTVLVHARDSPFGGNGMHDPEAVSVKQHVEFGPSGPKPPVWTFTSSPSARMRSITTGTSSRSPGAARSALIAACSGPSRNTPMLDTPQRLETGSARSASAAGLSSLYGRRLFAAMPDLAVGECRSPASLPRETCFPGSRSPGSLRRPASPAAGASRALGQRVG